MCAFKGRDSVSPGSPPPTQNRLQACVRSCVCGHRQRVGTVARQSEAAQPWVLFWPHTIPFLDCYTEEKQSILSWKDGSVVKSICSSYGGLGFGFQHPPFGLLPSVTPGLMLSSGLPRHEANMQCTYIDVGKTPVQYNMYIFCFFEAGFLCEMVLAVLELIL